MLSYSYDINTYRKKMIGMLKDFCVPITTEIKREINNRNTEISIENFCNRIISEHLDNVY